MTRRIRLLAHNVRSLWNVGSFFRTADAFSVEMVLLSGYTGVPPRKEIAKTALGAEEWVPWRQVADPAAAIDAMRKDGWQVVALELAPDAASIEDFAPAGKVCLLVGHEVTGVDDALRGRCDATVQIPMRGRKESLNVAVAAGIALHRLATA